MSRAEIIAMAREADLIDFRDADDDPHTEEVVEFLERFAALVAAREREACAALCAEWGCICDSGRRHGAKVGAQECVTLIRKRSTS